MSSSERMAPVDTTWLRMDRPSNFMVIVGVLVLAGPVDMDRVEATLAERLLAYRRFRQRVETLPTGTWWSDDVQFDLGRHFKRARLPGSGDKGELEKFVADLAGTPLDPAHPLWQFHLIEDYEGGAAIVVRIHHAIADGMALIGVLLSLTDGHPAAVEKPQAPRHSGRGSWLDLIAPVLEIVGESVNVSGKLWRQSTEAASHPARVIEQGAHIAAELAYLLLMPSDSQTRLKGQPGGIKRVAWTTPISLAEVKAASHALGCSVNDILLAAVAGAINGYLAAKGDPTAGVEIRALVPVNLRKPGSEAELGNRFGIVALELPIGLPDPLARLIEIHRRMEALKASYEPPVTLGLLSTLGYAPKLVQDKAFEVLLSRATAVMTNVPGPQEPLYIAGSEVKQLLFWVPQAGDIGLGVSILSFNGNVQFGLMADAALVPDPHAITERFAPEFEQLLYYVLLEQWPILAEEEKAPEEVPARGKHRKRRAARR